MSTQPPFYPSEMGIVIMSPSGGGGGGGVSNSFQPPESPVSIKPPFLMFLASLWVFLEVYFFVWPNFDFLHVFRGFLASYKGPCIV